MATTKNLCAQIPIDLHEWVSEERERLGQTSSEYITNLIQEYYDISSVPERRMTSGKRPKSSMCLPPQRSERPSPGTALR